MAVIWLFREWVLFYSITTIFMMPIFGINQGVQPIIGYNYGAKQYERVKEALRLASLGATALVTLGWITTRLFPTQLISLFGRSDAELLELSIKAMRLALYVSSSGNSDSGLWLFSSCGQASPSSLSVSFSSAAALGPGAVHSSSYLGFEGSVYQSAGI